MRLRIRDRKLKAKEEEIRGLESQKTTLTRHLSERTVELDQRTEEIQRAAEELSHMKTAFDVLKKQDHETLQSLSDHVSEEKKLLTEMKDKYVNENTELKAQN